MSACCCMGPQNGEPLCPCRMRAAGQYLEKRWAPVTVYPQGCICPPTSERTCMNQMCPRKAIDTTPMSVSPTVVTTFPARNSDGT